MAKTRPSLRHLGVVAVALLTTGAAGAVAQPAAAAPAHAVLRRACAPAHDRVATCYATYLSGDHHAVPARRAGVEDPQLTPADIASAYGLPASGGPASTVAIVDAQDNPNAERDLAAYRARFKLPPCTTANGCFRKVDQRGSRAPLPDPDPGWGLEIALDLDAVSAACPSCRILLVEADSPELADLGTAVDTAARLGAKAISNSYGATEYNGSAGLTRRYFTHPGVAITASSGDDGFGVPSVPATLSTVVSVGGTSLTRAAGTARGWRERVWDGAGSGCSGYVAKPPWQHDTHCSTRAVSDVSAVADLASGFVVRDTYGLGRDNGYLAVGGTSLSSPLLAGMIVRAGHPDDYPDASRIYAHRASFHDVTAGSNGFCGGDYLCTGKTGYDGPTGVGTPAGLGGL